MSCGTSNIDLMYFSSGIDLGFFLTCFFIKNVFAMLTCFINVLFKDGMKHFRPKSYRIKKNHGIVVNQRVAMLLIPNLN